jgi:hypothetical protein
MRVQKSRLLNAKRLRGSQSGRAKGSGFAAPREGQRPSLGGRGETVEPLDLWLPGLGDVDAG